MTKDLQDFLSDITWFFREPQKLLVMCERQFQCTIEFETKFPLLTRLLNMARITIVQYENETYELFGWTGKNGDSLGWLCLERVHFQDIKKSLHPDHILLLQNFGGITERWNEPEDNWLCNLNYAFPYDYSEEGFKGWEEPFIENCEEEGFNVEIIPANFVTFAEEANGNITMYHKENGDVLMYAHDHCFDHIEPLRGYPEYTLYKINNCEKFINWVETVARQWLEHIK